MLAMTLDHQTGDLDGDVLKGSFAGRSLGSLGLQDLLRLLMECQRDDPRSAPLLETYLDRHQHGVAKSRAWRPVPTGNVLMRAKPRTRPWIKATACSILNVSPTASADEIKDAHRRLMNKCTRITVDQAIWPRN